MDIALRRGPGHPPPQRPVHSRQWAASRRRPSSPACRASPTSNCVTARAVTKLRRETPEPSASVSVSVSMPRLLKERRRHGMACLIRPALSLHDPQHPKQAFRQQIVARLVHLRNVLRQGQALARRQHSGLAPPAPNNGGFGTGEGRAIYGHSLPHQCLPKKGGGEARRVGHRRRVVRRAALGDDVRKRAE